MDIPFSSEKMCPPVLSVPLADSPLVFCCQLTARTGQKETFEMNTAGTAAVQQFLLGETRT